jgi:hypothetical protein
MSRPHGSFITYEDMEATSLRGMIYTLTHEDPYNPNVSNMSISVDDILTLIEELEHQGQKLLNNIEENNSEKL